MFMIWTAEFVRFANATLRVLYVPEKLRHKIQRADARRSHWARQPEVSPHARSDRDRLAREVAHQWHMMYLSLLSFGCRFLSPQRWSCWSGCDRSRCARCSGILRSHSGLLRQCTAIFPRSSPAVLAASIYYHMIQYIPGDTPRLVWLNGQGIRLGEVEQCNLGRARLLRAACVGVRLS